MNEFVETNFLGMQQRVDAHKLPAGYSPLLINISNDKPYTWGKRPGSVILGSTLAGNGVYGMANYEANDGTNVLRISRSTNLYTYNPTTDAWTSAIAAAFPASRVEATNYLNRVYWIGSGLNLSYETGSSLTSVGTASNKIKATCIATSQNTLYVGNVTSVGGGAVSYQDRVYYSLFRGATTATDQLFEDTETLATSTRWFSVGAPIKCLYPNPDSGQLLVFTSKQCFLFDITFPNNNYGPRLLFNIGCANQRSVTTCNGWLVWMDNEARIWAWGGAGKPIPLSWDIEDDSYEEAIINKIPRSQLSSVCAGSDKNKFYFSVGPITTYGTTFSNCVIRGLATQSFDSILWSLDYYPYKFSIFANTYISDKQVLVGACTNNDAYLLNTGTNDNGTAINAIAKTRFIDFDSYYDTKTDDIILIEYRPQSAESTNLKVAYAVDGSTSYTAVSDPDAGQPLTAYGSLDMYNSSYSTKLNDLKYIFMPKGIKFRRISIEISNNQVSEDFEISSIGLRVQTIEKLNTRAT